MSFENLDDYILRFQKYQEGNYEYGTITSPEDVKYAIESGKKVVFLKSKTVPKMMVILGSVFIILGLILGIIISVFTPEYWIMTFSISMGFTGGVGLYFLIPGLRKIGTSFVVLGPEGIVYKLPRGAIQGYKWAGISMDFFGVQSTIKMFSLMKIEDHKSFEINISMPNGDLIKISPGTYRSREFHKPKTYIAARNVLALFMLTFKAYYGFGKRDTFERRSTEEYEQRITQNLTRSTTMVRENYLEKLKEEYQKYKKKKYDFGRYGTTDQIRNEFLKGKTFVLKGGLRRGDWGLIIFFCAMGSFMFIMITLISFILIGLGVFVICFWTFFALIFLIKLRILLVISSFGVYYRKSISVGFFLWDNVVNIEGITRIYRGITTTIVTLYLSNGEKKKFASRPYLIKEFPKEVEREMFLSLFKIYSRLGRNPNL